MQQDMLSDRSLQTVSDLLKEKKKDRALLALKKRKLHDRQALQLENNILLLDERMSALETSAQQADLIAALKKANGAIKAMQQQAPLEEVERLLDESSESAQYVVCAPPLAACHAALSASPCPLARFATCVQRPEEQWAAL